MSTQLYGAPEVLGSDPNSETSIYTNSVDIWSLGCVIYELLVGARLFASVTQVSRYFHGMDPFPEYKLKGLSIPIYNAGILLLKSMLTIQPEDRPTAAGALGRAWLVGLDEDSRDDQDETAHSGDEQSLNILNSPLEGRYNRQTLTSTVDPPRPRLQNRRTHPISTRGSRRELSNLEALEDNSSTFNFGTASHFSPRPPGLRNMTACPPGTVVTPRFKSGNTGISEDERPALEAPYPISSPPPPRFDRRQIYAPPQSKFASAVEITRRIPETLSLP